MRFISTLLLFLSTLGVSAQTTCVDPLACNFTEFGECEFLDDNGFPCVTEGCAITGACNFDPEADINDGSCEFTSCLGCTDEAACNYDSEAVYLDLSCIYFVDCNGVCGGDWIEDECGNCYAPDLLAFDTEELNFDFSESIVEVSIPEGVIQIKFDIWGAQGSQGNSPFNMPGGLGAYLAVELTQGYMPQQIEVLVGGQQGFGGGGMGGSGTDNGGCGPNNPQGGNGLGGNGGGYSAVFVEGQPLVVAAGGGGGGSGYCNCCDYNESEVAFGGDGGILVGLPGDDLPYSSPPDPNPIPLSGGAGGEALQGGLAGVNQVDAPYGAAGSGEFLEGGDGASGGYLVAGGGGGGGYFGGGGGGVGSTGSGWGGGGGGGGSSFIADGLDVLSAASGARTGNGYVRITFVFSGAPECELGCVTSQACNFNPEATNDDGSCDFCFCGPGTEYSIDEGQCLVVGGGSDINGDGCTNLNDLLDLLAGYGSCID